MKRWSNIVAIGGFLIVLAFVAERLLQVRALWPYLHDLGHDPGLMYIGLLILVISALVLALFAIPWGVYLLWKGTRRKPPENRLIEPPYTITVRGRHVFEVAVLSVVMGGAAEWISNTHTPGWLVLGTLVYFAQKYDFDFSYWMLLIPPVVDGAICFAILCGGCVLWMRSRQERSR